jgi:hypothetical protein
MAVVRYEFLDVRSGAVDVSDLECGTLSLGVWCPVVEFSAFEGETYYAVSK